MQCAVVCWRLLWWFLPPVLQQLKRWFVPTAMEFGLTSAY